MLHAPRYLHPLREGPVQRGVPTAWGAPPLNASIAADEPPPVWPSALGGVRGPAIEPLDPCLPRLVESWPQVAELAALADGLRIGDARTRDAAARQLKRRLKARA